MNKKVLSISVVAVVAIGAIVAPKIGGSVAETKIQEKTAALAAHGLEMSFENQSGYFSSKRDFTAVIKDGSALATYIVEQNTKDPDLKSQMLETIADSKVEYDGVLNGMVLKGEIVNSNLGLSNIKMDFYLADVGASDLNPQTQKILDDKKFAFLMEMTSTGSLESFSLKDNEIVMTDVDYSTKSVDAKWSGVNFYSVDGDSKTNSFKSFSLNVLSTTAGKMAMDFSDFKAAYSYADALDHEFDLSWGHFKMDSNGETSTIDGFAIASETSSNAKEVEFSFGVEIKKGEIQTAGDKITFANLKNSYELEGLSKSALEEFADFSVKNAGKQADVVYQTKVLELSSKILNNGMKLEADLSFDALASAMQGTSLGKTSLETEFKLPENKAIVGNQQSMASLMGLVVSTVKLSLQTKDMSTLSNINPMIGMYSRFGEVKGETTEFNIVYENSAVTINGKPLQ